MACFSVLHVVKSCPKNPTDDPPACPNFACQEVGAEVVLVGKEETALSLRFLGSFKLVKSGHKIWLKSSEKLELFQAVYPL